MKTRIIIDLIGRISLHLFKIVNDEIIIQTMDKETLKMFAEYLEAKIRLSFKHKLDKAIEDADNE